MHFRFKMTSNSYKIKERDGMIHSASVSKRLNFTSLRYGSYKLVAAPFFDNTVLVGNKKHLLVLHILEGR